MTVWICEDCLEPWPYRAEPEPESECDNCGGPLVCVPSIAVVRQHGNLDTGAALVFGPKDGEP